MSKYFKNTHCNHQLSNGSLKMTKCGIRVDEFTNLINKDTMMVIPPHCNNTFTPYPWNEELALPLCKKCNK